MPQTKSTLLTNQPSLPGVAAPLKQFNLEEWDARLGSVCGSFHTKAEAGQVQGSVSLRPVLGIDVAQVNVSSSHIMRGQKDVRKDGGNYFFLIGQKVSSAHIQHQQRSVLLQPGDLVLVDSSQQSQFVYPGSPGGSVSGQMSVHIPRNLLDGKLAGHVFGERIEGGSDLAQCVWEQLTALQEVADLLSDDRLKTVHFRELFLKAFTHLFYADRHQKKFVQAVLLLLREAGETSHGVDYFASMTASSRRTFTRIFEKKDTSFGELLKYIRLLRFLQLCKLHCESGKRASVSSLIYQSGFSDVSNFNHLFKSNFGVAPSVLLAKDKPL